MLHKKQIIDYFSGKKIIILGFGREGISTYKFFRKYLPDLSFTVADKNQSLELPPDNLPTHIKWVTGPKYDQNLNDYDLIVKTPGISLSNINYYVETERITSQTEILLRFFSSQVVGITGTKGKSTTASLTYHILKQSGFDTLFAGNIGVPFFDIIHKIHKNTIVVAELSAHQLQFVSASPHVAVLLNLYQEHLDFFNAYSSYQNAKLNIVEHQNPSDYFIYNYDDIQTNLQLRNHDYHRLFLPFSRNTILKTGAYSIENKIVITNNGEPIDEFDFSLFHHLPGKHNFNNYMAAILSCKIFQIPSEKIKHALSSFKGLEHRIEFVGEVNKINFFNDSISTIPEATIAALEAVNQVDTLILGGFDRHIDYNKLYDFLTHNPVKNIAFTGPAGKRMMDEMNELNLLTMNYIIEDDFAKIVDFAFSYTANNRTCILSPAASSYDQFKNFEERGKTFKKLVLAHS